MHGPSHVTVDPLASLHRRDGARRVFDDLTLLAPIAKRLEVLG